MTTENASAAPGVRYFTASDGNRLAYYVDDFSDPWLKAPTLVMLHSANGRAQRFYAMVPGLARHYRVVRLDTRGHGSSQIPDPSIPLTMQRLTLDVAELIDHLGCASVHVLGNSAGGYLAQHLAMDHPEKVRSMLLFGSVAGLKNTNRSNDADQIARANAREVFAATVDYHIDRDKVHPGLVEWFLDEAGKNDTPYISRFIKLMGSMEWGDQLHRVKCPTLVVIPGAEVESGKRSYASLIDNIPKVEVITYPGARHNICDSDPDRCSGDALAFLKKIDA
jgi:pimeloyl-ACP methyl ester carboxylesterase